MVSSEGPVARHLGFYGILIKWTHGIHTCGQFLASGIVITCFNELIMSRPKFNPDLRDAMRCPTTEPPLQLFGVCVCVCVCAAYQFKGGG